MNVDADLGEIISEFLRQYMVRLKAFDGILGPICQAQEVLTKVASRERVESNGLGSSCSCGDLVGAISICASGRSQLCVMPC